MEKVIVQADPDLQDVIPDYLRRRHQDVPAIAEAIGRGDYKAVEVIGHRLRGTGASYGFADLSRIGTQIEAAAIDRNGAESGRLAIELKDYLARVEVRYSA